MLGRVPNFEGSDKAAQNVRLLTEWKEAKVVFVKPDFAQQKVREYVLLDGKLLVMASSKLQHGYVVVDPAKVRGSEHRASTIRGAFSLGKIVDLQQMPRPDLIVEGSVAVNLDGNRLGKGGGYGDNEIRTLKTEFGSLPVVTTLHDMQVVPSVPSEERDEKVSIISTPKTVIRVSRSAEHVAHVSSDSNKFCSM
ncbi:MAG TPA: 5-formyltetrahydrofolate cyclo-ligase [Candidatus Acidoferrales bacterium]|nr:5-formyltetrahydrofolate cyclo-ligase [Candidatus Acidoferrales bacterium]